MVAAAIGSNETKNIQKLDKGYHWEFEEKLEEK